MELKNNKKILFAANRSGFTPLDHETCLAGRQSSSLQVRDERKVYQKLNKNHILQDRDLTGFTLVELILYLSLAAILLFLISIVLSEMFEARVQNQVVAEVEEQAQQILQVITQTTRNAENINSPLPGMASGLLSLDVFDPLLDPTIFDLDAGVIRIKEGAGAPLVLNNSRVIASSLNFVNLSKGVTPGTVRVSFTLSHVNLQGRAIYDYAKTFYGSATLRQ